MSVKANDRDAATSAARTKASGEQAKELENNRNSSSDSSRSSGSSMEEGKGEKEDVPLNVSTVRSEHRQSRRLKKERKKKRKSKTTSSNNRTRYRVPVKTVCTVNNTNDNGTSQHKKGGSISSWGDNFQLAGSVLGAPFAVFYYAWQYYEKEHLQILAPTIAVVLGVGCLAAVLIWVQDFLDGILFLSSSEGTLGDTTASVLYLPRRLSGREANNSYNPPPRPQSTRLPQSDLSLPRNSKPSLSHIIIAAPRLRPIEERVLEEKWDQWWDELDSQTQYYALILGYTQFTWDADHELEDLSCEDWDWDEMTSEQKAAAKHFGYTQEEWDVE